VVSDANHQPGRKVGSKRRFQPLKLPWLRLRRAMGTPGCSEEIQDFLVLLEGWNVVRADDAETPRCTRPLRATAGHGEPEFVRRASRRMELKIKLSP